MSNRARQVGTIALILVVGAIAATAWWWWDARTRPDAVARRIAQAAIARYPAATVGAPAARIERVTLESGRSIDLSLAPVIARCRDDRFACSGAIDTAIDDLARVEKLAEAPDRDALRALVVDEDLRGFQLGLIAEPLVGSLEVRYALVSGSASSFVTPTIADRLGINAVQLREIALARVATTGAPRVEALRDTPGLYQVLGDPDPVVELMAPDRMRRIAAIVGAQRLVGIVPRRAALIVARDDAAGRHAVAALLGAGRANGGDPPRPPIAFTFDATRRESPLATVSIAAS